MKKLVATLAVLIIPLFAFAGNDGALGFGLVGGFSTTTFQGNDLADRNLSYPMFHAGCALKFGLPRHFSIETGAFYHGKGAKYDLAGEAFEPAVEGTVQTRQYMDEYSFVEVPLYLQWGPDLFLFRPYIEAGPYGGYCFYNRSRTREVGGESEWATLSKNSWDNIKRWEYGFSFGGGVEIWKFQISAKYQWNLSNILNNSADKPKRLGTLMISAGYFF